MPHWKRTKKRNKKNSALAIFDEKIKLANERASKQKESLSAPFDAKIKEYEGYIENAKGRNDFMTYQNKQLKNIASQEKKKSEVLATIDNKLGNEIVEIEKSREQERIRLNSLNDVLIADLQSENTAGKKEENKFKETFKKLFGYIAGYSIIIALLISSALALLKARAGIEPSPMWEEGEYKMSAFLEILNTPLVILKRKMLNKARAAKQGLDDLLEPEKEFSYDTYKASIVPLENTQNKFVKSKAITNVSTDQIEKAVEEHLLKCEYEGDKHYINAYELISMYLLTSEEEIISDFIEQCIKHYNGEGENPFHRERRKIGFISNASRNAMRNASSHNEYNFSENKAQNASNALRNAANAAKICEAQGCGKSFVPNVPHHKFCSNACRQVANGIKNRL
jgi:signal recognition particle subunit SEC65